jgi:hypothetical protein
VSRWTTNNATLVVHAGVDEHGAPTVVVEVRRQEAGPGPESLVVHLSASQVAVVQAGISSAWEEALEMARGVAPESPS